MNEFELIARHFARPVSDVAVRVGIGDDAAIVAPSPGCELAIAVDMLVEGRHFAPGADAESLGHKTLAVNLSDMAAMGATPRWALLAGALPDADPDWLTGFARGLHALAGRFGVALIGGDTTRGPRNLCLTIVGELPAGTALLRSGAVAGDDIHVSGTLGDAALALAAIDGRATVAPAMLETLRERLDRPEPRVALGSRLRGVASAALDVSDGLCGDLGHILEASGVGARLELSRLPAHAELTGRLASPERNLALACLLAGGDDYELCFTASPARRQDIARVAAELALPLTRIGTIVAAPGLAVQDESGAPLAVLPRSFDHFG